MRRSGKLTVLPCLQGLERRVLLAFAELSAQGMLLISGTDAANQITVTASGAQVTAAMDGASLQFPLASVKRISIDCGAGEDHVMGGTVLPFTILGGDGNDSLIGGGGNDSIDGGAGDDTLDGGAGGDDLTGGDGTDTFDFVTRSSSFTFRIGFGSDASPQPFLASPVGGSEIDHGMDHPEIVNGTALADRFIPSGNSLHAFPFRVSLFGGGSNDLFGAATNFTPIAAYGGAGDDSFESCWAGSSLFGGSGNDSFVAPKGCFVDGGPGLDALTSDELDHLADADLREFASVENATDAYGDITGTDGANFISTSPEADTSVRIRGNLGNDTIVGSSYSDRIDGGDGDDIISGGGGNDTIYGGAGDDVINGNSGNDRISGGAGNDTLLGSSGRDRLYGEAGDDLLSTRDNKIDTLTGGDGTDSAKLDHKKTFDVWSEVETLI
jgi:Ca2+-binding RTX toxin-like protein